MDNIWLEADRKEQERRQRDEQYRKAIKQQQDELRAVKSGYKSRLAQESRNIESGYYETSNQTASEYQAAQNDSLSLNMQIQKFTEQQKSDQKLFQSLQSQIDTQYQVIRDLKKSNEVIQACQEHEFQSLKAQKQPSSNEQTLKQQVVHDLKLLKSDVQQMNIETIQADQELFQRVKQLEMQLREVKEENKQFTSQFAKMEVKFDEVLTKILSIKEKMEVQIINQQSQLNSIEEELRQNKNEVNASLRHQNQLIQLQVSKLRSGQDANGKIIDLQSRVKYIDEALQQLNLKIDDSQKVIESKVFGTVQSVSESIEYLQQELHDFVDDKQKQPTQDNKRLKETLKEFKQDFVHELSMAREKSLLIAEQIKTDFDVQFKNLTAKVNDAVGVNKSEILSMKLQVDAAVNKAVKQSQEYSQLARSNENEVQKDKQSQLNLYQKIESIKQDCQESIEQTFAKLVVRINQNANQIGSLEQGIKQLSWNEANSVQIMEALHQDLDEVRLNMEVKLQQVNLSIDKLKNAISSTINPDSKPQRQDLNQSASEEQLRNRKWKDSIQERVTVIEHMVHAYAETTPNFKEIEILKQKVSKLQSQLEKLVQSNNLSEVQSRSQSTEPRLTVESDYSAKLRPIARMRQNQHTRETSLENGGNYEERILSYETDMNDPAQFEVFEDDSLISGDYANDTEDDGTLLNGSNGTTRLAQSFKQVDAIKSLELQQPEQTVNEVSESEEDAVRRLKQQALKRTNSTKRSD